MKHDETDPKAVMAVVGILFIFWLWVAKVFKFI